MTGISHILSANPSLNLKCGLYMVILCTISLKTVHKSGGPLVRIPPIERDGNTLRASPLPKQTNLRKRDLRCFSNLLLCFDSWASLNLDSLLLRRLSLLSSLALTFLPFLFWKCDLHSCFSGGADVA